MGTRHGIPPHERALARTVHSDTPFMGEPCWIFTGSQSGPGYGQVRVAGRNLAAHRVVYEGLIGPIPEGLQLDHLCRTPRCVNPNHLDPVTPQINVLRGNTVVAANAAKTHCYQGHPLSGDNLSINTLGSRVCLACRRQVGDRYRKRLAARYADTDGGAV